MRQEFADPGAGFAMLLKFIDGWYHGQAALTGTHSGKPLAVSHRVRKVLTGQVYQFRFVIERFKLGRSAGHKEINNPFCLWNEMGNSSQHFSLGRKRISRIRPGSGKHFCSEQGAHGHRTKPKRGLDQEISPVQLFIQIVESGSMYSEIVDRKSTRL